MTPNEGDKRSSTIEGGGFLSRLKKTKSTQMWDQIVFSKSSGTFWLEAPLLRNVLKRFKYGTFWHF